MGIDPTMDNTKRIWLRRWALACSHAEAALHLIDAMPYLNKLTAEIGTTSSGLPNRPDDVAQWIGSLSETERAAMIGRIGAVNVNLGYAYEGAVKLLLDIEGIAFSTRGAGGHNLPMLYKKLPGAMLTKIGDLYGQITNIDLEFNEGFGVNETLPNQGRQQRKTFLSDLEYYHEQKYLQASRYKYADATDGKAVFFLYPLRFSELIKLVINEVVSQKLTAVKNVSQAK
ncbi:MAG: hypothetical protein OXC53_12455 [Rhodobacteraceae bacterium]|nr:hypothetical protein [Paracoccaceae bacterium]